MKWEEIAKALEAEIKWVHELMMKQTGPENIKKLSEAQDILIRLHERNFK